MEPWILVFHVMAFVLWIGGLMVGTRLLGQAAVESDPAGRDAAGRAAMSMLRSMTDPGAGSAGRAVSSTALILRCRDCSRR